MFEPCIKIWKVVLNFDWIMAIENDKNALLIQIYIFSYMQSPKKGLILI